MLIENGTDINSKNPENGESALHVATIFGTNSSFLKLYSLAHYNGKKNIAGKQNIVKYLLQNRARVNDANEERKTALHFAAERRTDITAMLIASCASLNPKDETMRTPLHLAATHGE